MLSLPPILNNATTFATHRPPFFVTLPQSSTKRFFLASLDPNLSVTRALWTLLYYFAGSMVSLMCRSASLIVGIDSPISYPDCPNVSRTSVDKTPLPCSAATSHTGGKILLWYSPYTFMAFQTKTLAVRVRLNFRATVGAYSLLLFQIPFCRTYGPPLPILFSHSSLHTPLFTTPTSFHSFFTHSDAFSYLLSSWYTVFVIFLCPLFEFYSTLAWGAPWISYIDCCPKWKTPESLSTLQQVVRAMVNLRVQTRVTVLLKCVCHHFLEIFCLAFKATYIILALCSLIHVLRLISNNLTAIYKLLRHKYRLLSFCTSNGGCRYRWKKFV